MAKTKNPLFSTTQLIMLSFIAAILLGSLLLYLPISTVNGNGIPYIDALFTATTATCVTGLVTLPIASTFNVFGQAVILLLIQIGGLGIITVVSALTVAISKKIGFKDSMLIQDALNLNSRAGLRSFLKKVIIGTFIVEGIGAVLYMPVFITDFGARGIWISIFNSVSAFCNAGIDIMGDCSLMNYAHDPAVNFITCALIILGGIGYIVWWDLIRVSRNFRREGFRCLNKLTLHTRIVLVSTSLAIFVGGIAILIFEWNNPLTIKEYSFFDKLQAAFFQSVTTRTAGFATFAQENLTNASATVCILLMFIGGSPVGTAGGIKTVTAAVLTVTALSAIKNKNEVTILGRTLSRHTVRKSVAVCVMSFSILFVSTLLLSAVTDAPFLDILYETVSATATVGLTRALTAKLDIIGKIIIIATMYLGRVGPISLAIAFKSKKQINNNIKNPTEDISVG